jgi:hypothetical protein
MTSNIYIKAQKNIGKFYIIDFLRNNILRNDIIYQISDLHILSGRFNRLFVLKETLCSIQSKWKVLNSKLKNYIIKHTISIEKKEKIRYILKILLVLFYLQIKMQLYLYMMIEDI